MKFAGCDSIRRTTWSGTCEHILERLVTRLIIQLDLNFKKLSFSVLTSASTATGVTLKATTCWNTRGSMLERTLTSATFVRLRSGYKRNFGNIIGSTTTRSNWHLGTSTRLNRSRWYRRWRWWWTSSSGGSRRCNSCSTSRWSKTKKARMICWTRRLCTRIYQRKSRSLTSSCAAYQL